MAKKDLYDYGFGTVWQDVYVCEREGYATSVTDYHEHDFYEINLILSGNVKILLRGHSEKGCENRIVLTRPGTPHYISCAPDTLYRRLYLIFTHEFAANYLPEWQELSLVFGERGAVLIVTPEETVFFKDLIEQIETQTSPFRKRLLIYLLLSHLAEHAKEETRESASVPSYIFEAISYLETHYAEKLTATDLARVLHIGRTTLMTEFKKYTGKTLGNYLTGCRLKNALRFLRDGQTLEYTSEQCGFSDSSGLIRAFRRFYGTTPHRYLTADQEQRTLL